tara:strand:- start:1174 stop:1596 length:423 start_codon:yes stop_codon:yes gene_type:complete
MVKKYDKLPDSKSPFKPTNVDKEILVKQIIDGKPVLAVSKKPGQVGRPRMVPKTFLSHKEMKELLGVKIKDMTPEQKRTYDRLAQRLEYAKTKQMEENRETSIQYKERIGKKIKDMTDNQRRNYYKLAKQEERLIKKYAE